MSSIIVCIVAIAFTYVAARRSLLAGLCAVLTFGYGYGILRANFPGPASYMLFDGVVAALYAARLFRLPEPGQPRESLALRLWALALCGWPLALLAIPVQEPLVQVVGLRAAVVFVPFLIFGARLGRDDVYRLALWCGVLNLVAFGFAAAEFQLGVGPFFPRNQMSEIIYKARDVANYTQVRLPSTFLMAHAYGGTMVASLPLVLGAWMQRGTPIRQRQLLMAAVIATILGVFLSATRTAAVILGCVVLSTVVSGGGRLGRRIAYVAAIGLVGFLVSREARMQRFTTLQDPGYIGARVATGVNSEVLDILAHHPLGNGLGGGGTNLPYFLSAQVHDRIAIENEYARIALEQGIPGLALWLGFLGWVFIRRGSSATDPWRLGKRAAWTMGAMFFVTASIGEGVLISIPGSALILLSMGWLTSGADRRRVRAPAPMVAGGGDRLAPSTDAALAADAPTLSLR